MVTNISEKVKNFAKPRERTETGRFSMESRGTNGSSSMGWRKPTSVIEEAATPGVFENMSTASPRTKLHNKMAHLGELRGKDDEIDIEQGCGIAEQVYMVQYQRLCQAKCQE